MKTYAGNRYGLIGAEENGVIPFYQNPEERMKQLGESYKANAKSEFEKEQHKKHALVLAEIFAGREFPSASGRKHSAEKEAFRVRLYSVFRKEAGIDMG